MLGVPAAAAVRLPAKTVVYKTIDPTEFLSESIFLEVEFLKRADQYDWSSTDGKKVLVKGCQSALIPPWAFMYITGKLVGHAHSIRFGNEHDNIVVYRTVKKRPDDDKSIQL